MGTDEVETIFLNGDYEIVDEVPLSDRKKTKKHQKATGEKHNKSIVMLKSSKSGTNLSNLLAESRTSATVVPGTQTTTLKKFMRKSATKALLST